MEVGASRLLEQKNWENPHLTVVPRYRNRSSVVELVGRDRLLFTRVEIGVTQIFAEKQMQNFGLKISTS